MNAIKNFFVDEWYFAIPMTLMALVAFALVAWRFLLNQTPRPTSKTSCRTSRTTSSTRASRGAIALCREEKGLIPQVLFVAGLEAAKQGAAAMRRAWPTPSSWRSCPS